jgi:hypothetical protein
MTKKTAALKASVAVIKSSPPKTSTSYATFDRVVRGTDEVARYVTAVVKLIDVLGDQPTARELEDAELLAAQWPKVAARCARFREAEKFFDSPEFYEVDDEGVDVISRRVVGEQIAVMVESDPGAPPPPTYVTVLVEEVIAASPSALALESTMRRIRRDEKFIRYRPKIAEVLTMLREEDAHWVDRRMAAADAEGWHSDLLKVICAARPKLTAGRRSA